MKLIKNRVLQSIHGRPFLADVFAPASGEGLRPLVIFTHGFQGFKDWGAYNLMAAHFTLSGFIFVKYNSSFNGTTVANQQEFVDTEAFGNNNFSKELDDLGVVTDWVCSAAFPLAERADTSKINLIGHSRGGGISLLKAFEDERVNKVASWAGVNEFGKFWKGDEMKRLHDDGVIYVTNGRTRQRLPVYSQLYEDYLANKQRLYIPDAVRNLQKPLLIVHGSADETVPFQSALELKEWKADANLLKVEGANHVFGASHPWEQKNLPAALKKVVEATAAFFTEGKHPST